jgi:acetoin:2,6-dichlorophenolindophenol oxidoreductase subunit alpha
MHDAAQQAIEQARSGGGPSFIESRTHRWRGHHEGEESYARPYREPVESEDPIDRLERTLADAGFEAGALRELLEGEEKAVVERALIAAQAEPEPPIHRAFEDVFA